MSADMADRHTRRSTTGSTSPRIACDCRTTSGPSCARSYREVQVQIPIKLSDGRTHVFSGYRVQHNGARGPYKGGIRYHPTSTSTRSARWRR